MTKPEALQLNSRVRLTKPDGDIFRDDDDREILTPCGTMGTVVGIDTRPTVTIYEVHWDNATFVLYQPESDGPDYLEVV